VSKEVLLLAQAVQPNLSTQAVEPAEYTGRLRRVRQAMAERSYGALIVTDPANLFYLTGYDAWSFYMPQCLLVLPDDEPHLFARAMDAAGAAFTCNLRAEQIHGYPETLEPRSASRVTHTSSRPAPISRSPRDSPAGTSRIPVSWSTGSA
jgi:Xaa-Pro aminopeptidase